LKTTLVIASLLSGLFVATPAAHAFCGFYVAGSDQPMFNDATQVVLMRKGTRTVLAMQNTYKGPPQDFAMVVPVPVVLHEGDVKTLPKQVFEDVERMSAPRLVEYWEQDPCYKEPDVTYDMALAEAAPAGAAMGSGAGGGYQVTVEAKFAVGEYDIEILSAKDSTGLDAWLKDHNYKIPAGAEPLLRPYVEGGSKWFVAKVDPKKVKVVDGHVALSPLRFHYDSEEFALPIRLGLANSNGTQDLIVNIIAPDQRYEVANYKNVTIPTNLDVTDAVRDKFPAFYAALYDRTVERNPGAVVTEYSWAAGSCDPCPGPTLTPETLETLGLDVLDSFTPEQQAARAAAEAARKELMTADYNQREAYQQIFDRYQALAAKAPQPTPFWNMVLTRLHARYGKDITNDLVFKQADPIEGGREFGGPGPSGQGAQKSSSNNFQARYAIRHKWTGPITCLDPQRGRWGGPPAGTQGDSDAKPALGLAFAPRGTVKLEDVVAKDVPEVAIKKRKAAGCGCQSSDPAGLLAALVLGAFGFFRPRRRGARQ
jgi:MYXO-CTERM domain-containing protein